jgi:hypothetical protein
MKYLLFLSFILFFKAKTYGQDSLSDPNAKIAIKIAEFKKKGISKYLYYYMQCSGEILTRYSPDSCIAGGEKYLIWKEEDKSYKQRFDRCRDYEAQVVSNKIFDIIDRRYKDLKKDSIKYPQYYDMVNGKQELFTVHVDHSCVSFIRIYWGTEILEKRVDDFATNTKDLHGRVNINYMLNRHTALYKLYLLTL